MEENKILDKIKKRQREMDTYRQYRVREWEDAEKRIYDRITPSVNRSQNDSEEAIRQPLEFAISYAKLSHLAQKPPKCNVTAVETSDNYYNDLINELLKYKMDEAGFPFIFIEAMKNSIDKGESFIKINYTENWKKIKLPKEHKRLKSKEYVSNEEEYNKGNTYNAEYLDYDGLTYEIIDNKNMWVDEGAKYIYHPSGVNCVNECIIRSAVTYEEFKNKYGRKPFVNIDSVQPTMWDLNIGSSYRNYEESNIDVGGNWVNIFEYYNVYDNTKVIIANDIIIYEGAIPCGRIPVAMLKNIIIPNRFYSKGDPEILRGMIGMSNSIFNKAEQQIEKAVSPVGLVGKGVDIDDLHKNRGGLIPIRQTDVSKSVNWFTPPDVTNGATFMMDYIKGLIIATSGFNYENLNSDPNQTAFGLALQQEQTMVRLGLFVRYNESYGLKDLFTLSLIFLQKFFPKKKARLITEPNNRFSIEEKYPDITVKGKKGVLSDNNGKEYMRFIDDKTASGLVSINPEFIQGMKFDIKVEPMGSTDDLLLVKNEKLNRMIQLLSSNPNWLAFLDDDKMVRKILEISGVSDSVLKKQDDVISNDLSPMEELLLILMNDSIDYEPYLTKINPNETQAYIDFMIKTMVEGYETLKQSQIKRIEDVITFLLSNQGQPQEQPTQPQMGQPMQPQGQQGGEVQPPPPQPMEGGMGQSPQDMSLKAKAKGFSTIS